MLYYGKRIPENSIQYRTFRHKTDSLGCSARCVSSAVTHARIGLLTKLGVHAGETLPKKQGKKMSNVSSSEAAKAVVRRNTEEIQGAGRFEVFDELFADDFTDHTPQPNTTPDKAGVRKLYTYIRAAFPDFHAEIHWQLADGDRVTTYKTYHGTHEGPFLGVAPTHRKIHFETVDVMRVQNGKITDHWGVGNLLSLMQQIGGWTQPAEGLQGTDDSTVKLTAREVVC